MQDVADDGAGRRGDDADALRQKRQELLARFLEQSFGGELLFALLDECHQRADTRRLERLDHDLVCRLIGVGRQPSGDPDFEPLLGLDAHAGERASPDHRLDLGALVLEGEIAVAGGVRSAETGNFAAHPHIAEGVLDGLFERRRKFGDGPFRNIEARRLVHCEGVNHLIRAASTRPDASVARPYPVSVDVQDRHRVRDSLLPSTPRLTSRYR